jgi:3-oxoadipate enol-lactonase
MRLAYEDHGSGPVVVLLHGFPLSRKMWSAQVASLSHSNRVIVLDLRGHGDSPAPEGVYTMDAMADDVVALLDSLSVAGPIVLGGHSMGGYISFAMTARHAERVRALILMDTRAGADSPEAARAREENARKVEETGAIGHVIDAMLPKLFAEITRKAHPEQVAAIRAIMERTPPRGVAGALRGMAVRPDRSSDLARIHVPTLIVVGAEDVLTPPSEAQRMEEALPSATLVEIPQAGHMAPVENPLAVNAALVAFLEQFR